MFLDADCLLSCNATVGNIGKKGEPDTLTYCKALVSCVCTWIFCVDRTKHTRPPF